jgi:hypothetical protein
LRALATDCVQNTRENAFGPEKTRFKKSLIIAFNAVIYQESNSWVEHAWIATKTCFVILKNTQENQRDSALTHP